MQKSIWKNFRFTRFFISLTTGNLGDWLDIFALQIIFVHEFHASPITMGIVALFYFLPSILLGPFAGVCADRFSKRNIMIITDLVSTIFTIGLFFSPNILSALILLFLRSSIASLNSPTQQAYIKQVVPTQDLLAASSYSTISFQFCKVFGPIVGALLLILFPARTCIAINAVSFFLSAMILYTLPADKPSSIPDTIHSNNHKKNWLQEIKSGAQFIWHHKLILNLVGLVMVWSICSMVRNSQIAIFLYHLLPKEPHVLGYVLGLDGLGAVITGSLLSHKGDIEHYALYFIVGFFLIGIGTLGIAIYQTHWPRFLFYISPLFLGFGVGINSVIYGYLLKKETAENQIGCVYGISSALQNSALAFGTIISGFLVLQFGVREVFIGLALTLFILSITSISITSH